MTAAKGLTNLLYVQLNLKNKVRMHLSVNYIQCRAAAAVVVQCHRRSFSQGFLWNDALLLRDQLTGEERSIHEAAVTYATEKLLPRVISANRHESFDRDIMYELGTAHCHHLSFVMIDRSSCHFDFNVTLIPFVYSIGDMGFLGSTIDGFGCPGVGYVSYGLIANAIEGIDSGYRSAMSVQSSLVMWPIHQYGSEEQKHKYLPDLAKGKLIGTVFDRS